MSVHDCWCDLCDDKIKAVKVMLHGKILHICNHCHSLCAGCEEVKGE